MRRFLKDIRVSASAVAVVAALAAVPANAQDAGDASDQDAEIQADADEGENTIVVLGRKFGSGLSRATFELGVEDIESVALGADISASLNRVPGIQVSTGDPRGGSFSFELFQRGLTDEQIGLSIDGIPSGDSRFNGGSPPNRFVESSNVGGIVVSQSSGEIGSPSRFALGGFINFQTEDPTNDFGVELETGYGSFDFQRVFLRLDTGEILPGLTSYVSYSYKENEVFAGRNARSSERHHLEFKALKEFDGGSTIRLRASYNDLADNDLNIISLAEFNDNPDSDRAGDILTGIPSIDADFGGALGGERRDWLVYLNGDFVLSDSVSLAVNPYYQSLRGFSNRYQDSQSILDGGDPRAVTGFDALGAAIRPNLTELEDPDVLGGPADLRVTPRNRDRYGVTSELRFEPSDILTFRTGLWYENSQANEDRNFFAITNSAQSIDFNQSDLNFVEYERDIEVDTFQLYGQVQLSLLDDRLKLDAGVTYLDIGYEAQSPLEFSTIIDFSQDSGLNPKFGLSFALTDELEIYGGYAQNFAGLPEDVFLGSSVAITPDLLDPIETDNADIGLRWVSDLGDTAAAFSLQGYWVNLKNNIGSIPTDPNAPPPDIVRGNVSTIAANIGGQETYGIEATAFLDFGNVDLYGSYSYQDARHDDPTDPTAIAALANVGVIAGEDVRDIPEHSFFIDLGWEPRDNVRLSVSGNYVGSRVGGHIIAPGFCNPFFCFGPDGNGVQGLEAVGIEGLPDRFLVALTASYTIDNDGGLLDGTRFQLNVDNLFDKSFITSASGATATLPEFGLIGGQGNTLDRYFIGAPRSVTFSVSTRF
jgi:iron complex outermembrane receptor protein